MTCNLGPLLEPTTSAAYRNGTARVPFVLFSHADQQNFMAEPLSQTRRAP